MNREEKTLTDSTAVPPVSPEKMVNWKQVGTFIGLTFGLTWILDLVLFLNGGLSNPAAIDRSPIPDVTSGFFCHPAGHVFLQRQSHKCQE